MTALRTSSHHERQLELGVAQGARSVCYPLAPLTAWQAQAADLGQRYAENTNYAVAVGLDYTVERTKAALAKVGADKAGEACLSVAEKSLAAYSAAKLPSDFLQVFTATPK